MNRYMNIKRSSVFHGTSNGRTDDLAALYPRDAAVCLSAVVNWSRR